MTDISETRDRGTAPRRLARSTPSSPGRAPSCIPARRSPLPARRAAAVSSSSTPRLPLATPEFRAWTHSGPALPQPRNARHPPPEPRDGSPARQVQGELLNAPPARAPSLGNKRPAPLRHLVQTLVTRFVA